VDWPSNWISRALDSAGIDATVEASRVMNAWRRSTPLPPLSNNPIGMPKGTIGAPSYMGTRYAIFPSMQAFYAAFKSFIDSAVGDVMRRELTADTPYAGSWRVISSLGWPGSDTETDYPSAVLDLSSASYRRSIGAAEPSMRQTSGLVGVSLARGKSAASQDARVNRAISTIRASSNATDSAIRKGK
jgi:hypothetical protein